MKENVWGPSWAGDISVSYHISVVCVEVKETVGRVHLNKCIFNLHLNKLGEKKRRNMAKKFFKQIFLHNEKKVIFNNN